MAGVKVDIKLELAILNSLDQAKVTALTQTADALKGEVVQAGVVPKDEGTLQNTMFVSDEKAQEGKVTLVHNTPYARRLYYHPEYNFNRTASGNKNAKGHWFEDWTDGDWARNAFATLFGRLTGI